MRSWEVTPVEQHTAKYQKLRRKVVDEINTLPVSQAQKAVLIVRETQKLKDRFRTERRAEYESKSTKVVVDHSCTNGVSGETKNCGWKFEYSPSSELYTRTDWIVLSGVNKGTDVQESRIGIRMTKTGKGTNKGSITGTFRFRPEVVSARVEADATKLFDLLLTKIATSRNRNDDIEAMEVDIRDYR